MNKAIEAAPTSAAEPSVAERVMVEQHSLALAAEEILWRLGTDQLPTFAERRVLQAAGIVDNYDLERERGRVDSVKTFMTQAGSPVEFDAASTAAVAAAKADQDRRPELEEQLAKLQAELDGLTAMRESTSRELGRFTSARERLRDPRLMPAFIREAYETDYRAEFGSKLGRRVREIRASIDLIDALQRIDLNTVDGICNAKLHCEAVAQHLIKRETSSARGTQNQQTTETFDSDGFDKYRKRRLEVERPPLEQELNELQEQHSDALSRVGRRMSYYVDRIV